MKPFMLGCLGVVVGGVVLVVACTAIFVTAVKSDPKSKAIITGNANDVTVQVGGGTTDGFSGSIGSVGTTRTVQGVSPQTYTVSGANSHGIITAVIQSKGRFVSTPLTVSLTGCPDGKPHTNSTSADYGVVTVTC